MAEGPPEGGFADCSTDVSPLHARSIFATPAGEPGESISTCPLFSTLKKQASAPFHLSHFEIVRMKPFVQ